VSPVSIPRAISSLTNDSVKLIKSLEQRKTRKETGLFVAEGASILITAAEHGLHPETLVVRAGAAQTDSAAGALVRSALQRGAEVLEVTPAILEKLAAKENPQTVLGVFRQVWAEVPKPAAVAAGSTWLALEEIRDPGNLGTIIRTADAVGAAGILLVGTCCDAWSRECVRATMGSIFAVPLARLEPVAFHALLGAWPGDTVGTHLSAKDDFRKVAYTAPTLLVMGGEGPGLSDASARACKRLVKIPMAGRLDSLNLAVATALALYQICGPDLAPLPSAR
jgi:RNA methyltransferase, TrmH family